LWIIVSVFCIGGGLAFIFGQGRGTASWPIFISAAVLHHIIAVWIASEASNSFAEARSTGAMELVLSTPMSVRQILRGQHQALRELFLGPLILLLSVELLMAIGQIFVWLQGPSGAGFSIMLILVLVFCLVWFVLDIFAVAEAGMWFGLTAQKPTQAMTKTVMFVLVLPLLLLVVPCCWGIGPGLMVAKSVIFFTWAQNKLETEFRRAATERYEPARKPKWLRRDPVRLRMPGAESGGQSY
jgi:hypothetical protein